MYGAVPYGGAAFGGACPPGVATTTFPLYADNGAHLAYGADGRAHTVLKCAGDAQHVNAEEGIVQ